ncbi:SDR family NAD(P)-dependent oxidoreductase [Enterovirga rhinocerotis]|uniref:NAD(P)-dependent dehydrogenase (Short-subunit alcohol dehydrogenase family) n=1 Tax=Enterovirga rhinocerotis TaxID=1339210 RepID=A0A4R7C8P0_9HYPH|nr:SDR family oxidoreductase [Enterovirga rhinocerotis]TDR94623.1 NAD(P)-dependent dehydrogenase (short-subunit alcohol dehydrogenase family) [Enterovirga rhinocerotis]
MELEGRIALITGAGSGLGLATARAFAREGAKVVINDLREETAREAAATLGPDHGAVGGDVSKEADVEAMVRSVIDRFGRIDILVNNAGVPDSFAPTIDQPLAHWQRLIDIHLTGTYLVSKTVAPHMIRQGGGAMANVSSIAGVMGLPVRTAYSAAKAGISMLTRVLGCEWGPHNIRVNAVAPGYILTPLTDGLMKEGKLDVNAIRKRTPMGKMGRPEDIAEAMVFLCSDRARFITTITMPVDGGYCAWGAPSDAFPGNLDDVVTIA